VRLVLAALGIGGAIVGAIELQGAHLWSALILYGVSLAFYAGLAYLILRSGFGSVSSLPDLGAASPILHGRRFQ
jgi:hypothetical protein